MTRAETVPMQRPMAPVLTILATVFAAGSCPAAPRTGPLSRPGPHTREQTVEVGDRTRTYYLHVPPRLPRKRALPLVLVFHGGGGRATGTETFLTHFSDLADRDGFLVAYPEGVGQHWNDGRDNPSSAAAKQDVDDLGFVVALIDAVARAHPLDRRRVYATGISNGGIFSHYLAANHADLIAAIAPVAGGLADPFSKRFHSKGPVSVLILQGTDDPLVPYTGGRLRAGDRGRVIPTTEAVKLWVKHDGCDEKPAEETLPDRDPADGCTVKRFTYAHGRNGTEVVLYRIEGGGHTWPGGPQYLPPRLIGRVCRDIDGSAVIWDFFQKHPKR